MSMTPADLASYLDATNLRLDAADADIKRLCEDSAGDGCACVMIYPASVPLAASILKGTKVGVGTVIGFPSGRFATASKRAEIRQASQVGATEVDIVLNYSALREGFITEVASEVQELSALAHELGLLIKVITENCYLPREAKLEALRICEDAGVDFIKTSTGFGSGGATCEDISLWKSKRRGTIRMKAAGGIRSLADAFALIEAGATRLGTSGASSLLKELRGQAAPTPPNPTGY